MERRAQVGIGTLIIFIALVLVAAIAASLLIKTSGDLQQRASQTGQQSTEEVSSALSVISCVGYDDESPAGNISLLAIYVETMAGTEQIDLSTLVLSLSDQNHLLDFRYDPSLYVNITVASSGDFNIFTTVDVAEGYYGMMYNNGSVLQYPNDSSDLSLRRFGVVVLSDVDGSLSDSEAPMLNRGDKAVLTVNLEPNGMALAPRTQTVAWLMQEVGVPTTLSFTTPNAYINRVIPLYG
ncbi:MAG: archaellin/type IV pilin N-terminal domain-containing protein [Methermicoccaceae archaeon]